MPHAPWSSAGHDRDAVGRHIVPLSTYLGHAHVTDTYWYLRATPILMRQIAAVGEALHRGAVSLTALALHLTAVREHLPHERRASPHTCAAYAYSFQLLLCFAAARLRTTSSGIEIKQLDPLLVLTFLEHIEEGRAHAQRPSCSHQGLLPLPRA